MPTSPSSPRIRLAVFDWAGTAVDFGSFAPVAPFVAALGRHGIDLTPAEARGPMGLNKKDHLRALLELPEIAAGWRKRHGRDWAEGDVERLYQHDFLPLQMDMLRHHCALVPGLLECVATLRRNGIRIGTTTGYFRAAAEYVREVARQQGYVPDFNVVPDEVPGGRPRPWMIFRNMEALGVYPPASVVKVGDTAHDMGEARNAGCWAVGVLASSSEVGVTEAEWSTMPEPKRQALCRKAAVALKDAGAHATIESLDQLPALIDSFDGRLADGDSP